MIKNGGIIGPQNLPSQTSATGFAPVSISGIYDSFQAYNHVRQATWPQQIRANWTSVTPSVTPTEGTSFTVKINLSKATAGLTLHYTIVPLTGSVVAADFTDGLMTGTFTTYSEWGTTSSGEFTKTLVSTDGIETDSFYIEIRLANSSGLLLANVSTITPVDASGNGSTSALAGDSAMSIKALTGTNTNGVYWINLPTVGPTQVYCLMDSAYDGGGWMLAMKGGKSLSDTTFSYSSSYWTTPNTLNPSDTTTNAGNAKYQSFNYFGAKDILGLWPDMTPANVMAERYYAFRVIKADTYIREVAIDDLAGATAASYTGGTSITMIPLEISARVTPAVTVNVQYSLTSSPTSNTNNGVKPWISNNGSQRSYSSTFALPASTAISVGVNKGSTNRSSGPHAMYFEQLQNGTVLATTTLVDGVANTITLTTGSSTTHGRFYVQDSGWAGSGYNWNFVADFYCYKTTTSQITWTGGSISNNTQWTWLENNFNDGSRQSLTNFFNLSYPVQYGGSGLFKRDAKTFSGWSNGSFSSQVDIRFYGFNYSQVNYTLYPSVTGSVRWGFGWNENGEGLWPSTSQTYNGTNDVFGGIGMASGNRSAGDYIACCQDTTGINRSARFEIYVR